MECTIYRSDLTQPITVREYFSELKSDHPGWTQMPRRMLRHKTLQQCTRLAFGISAPESKIHFTPPITKNLAVVHFIQEPTNRKALLKQKLSLNMA